MLITIGLGVYFLYTQVEEYLATAFTMSDGVYGRIFFMATGFHGAHVLIGTCMLRYVFYNFYRGKLLFNHHFSFEAAA